ncbi:hypothetical protein FDUTEX481_09586 [Tolypothrix sp. PCC 7601]|nr:hypothetical protein FDUTEX481_09586 [Tolypothrix sp. PCC 7601]
MNQLLILSVITNYVALCASRRVLRIINYFVNSQKPNNSGLLTFDF